MEIFRLRVTSIARGDGHSAVGAAAYRAGEKIRDDRTNELHDHSSRKDVTHSEILLPGHLTGENMDWALNRAALWNSVESAESRKNARVATEIQVTLPFELRAQGRLAIARTFAQEVADHYRVAVDLAVHDPRPSADPREFHAHLLLTTRELSAAGLGPRTGLNMPSSERVRLGLPSISEELKAIRERWTRLTNEALEHTAPRSLEDIRREAKENWLRIRAEQNRKPATSKDAQGRTATSPPTHSAGAQSRGANGAPHDTARTQNSPAPDDDYQP